MAEKKRISDQTYRDSERPARRRRRRKPTPLAYLVILVTIAACVVSVSVMIFLKVKTIRVTGAGPYTAGQIIDAGGIRKGTNLLAVSEKKVSDRICRQLPYVKSVQVRLLPLSRVTLIVKEDRPSSIVALSAGYAILDNRAKVLEIASNIKGYDLPLVRGMKISHAQPGLTLQVSDQHQIQTLNEIKDGLEKCKLRKISSIDITNDLEISVGYNQKIKIVLGTLSDLNQKLNLAAYIITHKISSSEKGSLDVTEASKAYFDPS